MPPGGTALSNTAHGDEIEARVAQVWFWEGYYARRGINMQGHYDPEPLLVTDLDLLSYSFAPNLGRSKHIGEVKTGTGRSAPKPLDRIIWLRGLRELVGADSAELTSGIAPSRRARELARGLGITAQAISDLERREDAAHIRDVNNIGAHGPQALGIIKAVHKYCSSDPELERAFWFLRSEVWFLDPITAVKRLIGLTRLLGRRWAPAIDDDDNRTLRWLFAEAASAFTLNAVTVAGYAHSVEHSEFAVLIAERLSEGVVPAHLMRRLALDIDKYLGGVLATAGAPSSVRVSAMGAFQPKPPDYTESLIELCSRLAATPAASRELPRQLDLLVFERLVHRRHLPANAVARIGLAADSAARLVRLVAAFLRSQAGTPDVLDRALTTAVENGEETRGMSTPINGRDETTESRRSAPVARQPTLLDDQDVAVKADEDRPSGKAE